MRLSTKQKSRFLNQYRNRQFKYIVFLKQTLEKLKENCLVFEATMYSFEIIYGIPIELIFFKDDSINKRFVYILWFDQ